MTEQVEAQETTQEIAEPLTQEQAQTEIDRLQSDPDFLKVYLSPTNSEPGVHKQATDRMTKLFALAHGVGPVSETQSLDEMRRRAAISEGKSPPDEKRAAVEQQQEQEQQTSTEDEQHEAELEESKQIMQGRFGDDWQEEMSGVRDSINEVGGDALFDHIQNNHGNDPEVMSQLMELQRENEKYPLVAALAELVDQNMTPNAALLKIEEHLADPAFVARYTNEGAPGHKASMARMRALFLAADPPEFVTSGVQG